MTRCRECGQPVHPHQLTCGSCGASLREGRASSQTEQAPEETAPPREPAGRVPERPEAPPRTVDETTEPDPGAREPRTAASDPEPTTPRDDALDPGRSARRDDALDAGPAGPSEATLHVDRGARETSQDPEPGKPAEPASARAPDTGAPSPLPPSRPENPAGARTRRTRTPRPRARSRGPQSSPAFGARAWALVVDAMLLFLASSTLPFFARVGIRAAEAVSGSTELYDDVLTRQLTTVGDVALVASYFTFVTAETGQTVGKSLMDLRVVRPDGRTPDALQSLVRCVGYLFSLMPMGFGFLLAAFSPRRALHDYLAGTIVLRSRDMPPAAGETSES